MTIEHKNYAINMVPYIFIFYFMIVIHWRIYWLYLVKLYYVKSFILKKASLRMNRFAEKSVVVNYQVLVNLNVGFVIFIAIFSNLFVK